MTKRKTATAAIANDLLAALEAVVAQAEAGEDGRYVEPPDAYAEIPWEELDNARAAIAKAKGCPLAEPAPEYDHAHNARDLLAALELLHRDWLTRNGTGDGSEAATRLDLQARAAIAKTKGCPMSPRPDPLAEPAPEYDHAQAVKVADSLASMYIQLTTLASKIDTMNVILHELQRLVRETSHENR